MAISNIANDIINQMGGNRFFVMTGCKAVADSDSVTFTIPRNASKANRFEVKYNEGLDLYNVRFYRYTAGKLNTKTYEWIDDKIKDIKEFENVYFDMLQDIFTSVTGLYTKL